MESNESRIGRLEDKVKQLTELLQKQAEININMVEMLKRR